MSFHNFIALLKKNFLVLKRTYILTFFEIASPILTLLILLLTNSKFETEHTPISINDEYLKDYCSFITTQSNYSNLCQNYNSLLVFKCKNSIIVLIGEDFPEEIVQRIKNVFWGFNETEIKFRHYESILELNDYIESKNYEKMTQVCFGISYEKLEEKYFFKLHFFASKYIKSDKLIARIPSSNIDNLDPFRIKPDFESYNLYLDSGFLLVQKILYDYVLREETGVKDAEIVYKIIPQKYEELTDNFLHKILDEIISVFILIAYSFPLCINIYRLIKEKETRAKEIMKIMGLDDLSYFFSYFVIYFVFNIIYALFNSLILKAILNYIELRYLFCLFFLYGLVIYSLIFFFQSFLDKANISIVLGLFVYSIMYFLGIPFRTNNINKSVKILFAVLFPPVNLNYGCNTLIQFQRNYNQFKGRTFMNYQKFAVKDMYVIFFFNFILYMFLGFYLQNVIQHQYGMKKSWNFLCTKNFWICKKESEEKNFLTKSLKKSQRFEKKKKINQNKILNSDQDLMTKTNSNSITKANNIKKNEEDDDDDIFHIKNIKKNFGEKLVLKDVSFNLYPNEIFVLLGHNGAGKTTLISILTGLINATSGKAIYNGHNILSQESSDYFRKIVGICPQHDVLFNDLTVEEHLELFCQFKSVEKYKISEEISSILKDIQLEEKRNTKASNLSGGQKRKLSIGLAMVGGSSIIFLDEPSSGMDITSRRNLWDILKRCLAGKIIILTTHFMEEASILGNRIGILSEGKMQCIGTPLELIEKYTNCINLNITKHFNADDDFIIASVLDNFGDLDINFENFNRDILFRIPTDKVRIDWSEFFRRLDSSLDEMKIKSYSISKSSLEDVFLNLPKIINKIDKHKNKELFEQNKKNLLKNSSLLFNPDNYEQKINYKSKFFKDFKVSFMKRILQIKREKKTLFLEILCPILLSLIGCIVGYLEFLEENKSFPLHLNQITNDSQIIYYNSDMLPQLYFSSSGDLSNIKFEKINLFSEKNHSDERIICDDLNQLYELKKTSKDKSYLYYEPFYIDENSHIYGFNLIIDITPRQAAPIYANFLMNKVVNSIINHNSYQRNIEIEIINEPLPFTYEEIKRKKNRKPFLIVFFIALAFSLIPSNFITIIIKERENNSKHLQIISGISLFGYWFNNYIFELIKYFFIGGISIIILLAFDFYEKYFVILYIEYGPAMISFTYLFSIILKSEYFGQISVLLINLIFGPVFAIAIITMRLYDKLVQYAKGLSYVLRIIPSFCFCYGYNQLIRRIEIYNLDEKDTENKKTFSNKDIDDNIISLNNVGTDCIYLAVECIFYLVILIILENVLTRNFIKSDIDLNEFGNNNDINLQASRIEIGDKKYSIKVQNLVKIYHDIYCNEIKAVKNISFNLDYGEIFGFLGVNGAGKTTTFKCLSNEIMPSYGSIYIDNYDISKHFNNVRNLIGYCPQFDTIFEFLTVYENLEFYGIIKGAKQEMLEEIIDAMMKEMNLIEFKNKISGTLSGGNKRKLSVAIALICNPPIILLDEPSTGMDPEARRHMWKAIYNVSINKKKSTIIMTTHSMEEAESLCKKIGILVNGRFKCLGTSDEIKYRYGYGFELNIQIKDPNIPKLFNIVRINVENIDKKIYLNTFDDCFKQFNINRYRRIFTMEKFGKKILEELNRKGFISLNKIILQIYYLKSILNLLQLIREYFEEIICVDYKDNNFVLKIKRNKEKGEKTIGFLFGLIEDNKNANNKQFNIGQYFLQYSSLEQIFNKFAEKENNENNQINVLIDQDLFDLFG